MTKKAERALPVFEQEPAYKTVLQIRGVSVSEASRPIFREVSFNIGEGEKVALVGPNGSGKTTLVRTILGERRSDKGEIILARGSRVAYVPQVLTDLHLNTDSTIYEYLLQSRGLTETFQQIAEIERTMAGGEVDPEILERYGALMQKFSERDGYEVEPEAKAVLNGIGLPGLNMDRKILTLSGGQKTKLYVAQAIVGQPSLLVLDEPTSHLDHAIDQWLGTYLKRYKGSVLVVAHDAEFLDGFVDKVVELNPFRSGCREYRGNYSEYLSKREDAESAALSRQTRARQEIAKQLEIAARLGAGKGAKVAHGREKLALRRQEELEAEMAEMPTTREQGMKVTFKVERPSGKEVVAIRGPTKLYEEIVLDYSEVDFVVQRGQRMAITGGNGAGKSTLLKMMAGVVAPDSGAVILGQNVSIGYYSQEQEGLDSDLTPMEEVSRSNGTTNETMLRGLLGRFLFHDDDVFNKVGVLSGGEKSRLALAKLVTGHHNLLLLDEPTNYLDDKAQAALLEALIEFDGTLVVISHDQKFLDQLGLTHRLKLPEGKLEIEKVN